MTWNNLTYLFSVTGEGTVVLGAGWVIVLIAALIVAAVVRDRFYSLTLALGAVAVLAVQTMRVTGVSSTRHAGESSEVTGLLLYGLPSLAVVVIVGALLVWRGLVLERRQEESEEGDVLVR